MVPHKIQPKPPKLKANFKKEPVPTYDGNYVPVSKDYEAYPIGNRDKPRECCHVKGAEKNHMLQSSTVRIQRDAPELKDAILSVQ